MPVDKPFPPIGTDPYGALITEWAGSVERNIAGLENTTVLNTAAGRSALIASPEMVAALRESGGGGGTGAQVVTPEVWEQIKPGQPGVLYIVSASAPAPGETWPIRADFAGSSTVPTATDTGQAWRIESGSWLQADGGLYAAADGGIIVADFLSREQTIEVEITGTQLASSNPTIVVRNDPSNDHHYRIGKVNTSELRIERRDPTSSILMQSPTGIIPTSTPYRVRVTISGVAGTTYIRVWVNDVEVIAKATGSNTYSPGLGWLDADPTPPLGTEAGFRMGFSGSGGGYRYSKLRGAPSVRLPAA